MPIQKETSAKLVKFGYNFEAIPRQVVEQIRNPVALAYYTYLLTRPDNWVVRRTQLMEHFGVGRARHDAAMKELKEMGLAWVQTSRDSMGQFTETQLMVGSIPVDDLPQVGKPTMRENPQVGESTMRENRPLKDIHSSKDIHIKNNTNKRFTIPTLEEVENYIQEKGYSVNPETFHSYYSANGWKVGRNAMKSWQSAITHWNTKDKNNANTTKSTQPNQDTRRLSAGDRVRAATAKRRAETAREIGGDLGGYE